MLPVIPIPAHFRKILRVKEGAKTIARMKKTYYYFITVLLGLLNKFDTILAFLVTITVFHTVL